MASADRPEMIHATTVAIGGKAILLTGASGSGKSDLGLRLIDRGARLVSDDYTILAIRNGALVASAPDTIEGKMEIRGVGIMHFPPLSHIPVALVVELIQSSERQGIQRMPEDGLTVRIAGVELPTMKLSPFEASATIKVEMRLRQLTEGSLRHA